MLPLCQRSGAQELLISSARLFLAGIALIAISVDKIDPTRLADTARALLLIYLLYALSALLATLWSPQHQPAWSRAFHAIDILWAGGISLVTEGPNSPFFLFFLFVVIAASYRWGIRRVLQTIAILLSILLAEAALLAFPAIRNLLGSSYDLNRLIMRMAYLFAGGVLIGLLAESEKRLRVESDLIAELLDLPSPKLGFAKSTELVMREIIRHYRGERIAVIFHNTIRERTFIGQVENRADARLRWIEPSQDSSNNWLFPIPAECAWVAHPGKTAGGCMAHWASANGTGAIKLPYQFFDCNRFERLLLADFLVEQGWRGRLILFDPGIVDVMSPPRLLNNIVQHLVPALHNVYLIEKIRGQAQAMERARIARELHDGAIQTLVGTILQLEVAKRRFDLPPAFVTDMRRIQGLVRLGVMKLRALMQGLQAVTIEPRDLGDKLTAICNKFQQQTGIEITLNCQLNQSEPAPAICREVLQIIQEGLINIHQHSGAKHASIVLRDNSSHLDLIIEDNGKGFDIAGRHTLAQLDQMRRGPIVLKQRVHTLHGSLVLDSRAGYGSSLQMRIPYKEELVGVR